MLNFADSKIMQSTERPVATGYTVTAEGAALIQDAVNGGVRMTAGVSTEIFAGVSLSQQLTPLAFPRLEALTVDGALYTVTLFGTPISGTLRVVNAAGSALAAGTPTSDATKYSISGNVITVNSTLAATTITVSYRYVPTTVQAKYLQGDIPPGGAASLILDSVGLITSGDIVTSEFDTSVDWTSVNASTHIQLAAGGLFTVGGSGAVVPNSYVYKLPTTSYNWLGIRFVA